MEALDAATARLGQPMGQGPARLAHRMLGHELEASGRESSTSTAAASICIFPHHENELAQTRCAFGTKVMANIWMHNGFLQVEGQKMSKSLGNFVTINELLKRLAGRGGLAACNMLRTHYRQPIDWTVTGLAGSAQAVWNDLR